MKGVGIGCIWFAGKGGEPKPPATFDPQRHIKQINDALNSVDNVSNVKLSGAPRYISSPRFNISEHPEENFFPIFPSLRIDFDIFFPHRLQLKYAAHREMGYSAENFHVAIVGTLEMPVAIISSEIPDTEKDHSVLSPSDSVVFIRKYLAEKLTGNDDLDFQFFGPSPFHADFFVTTANESGKLVASDISGSPRGYKSLLFEMPTDLHTDPVEAFIERFKLVLGSYYNLVGMRNVALFTASRAIELTRELLAQPLHKQLIQRYKRHRAETEAVDLIYDSILTEKINRIDIDKYLAELRRNGCLIAGDVFEPFFSRELEELEQSPTEDIKQVLQTVEDRTKFFFGNISTWAAGIIAGIIGACFGAILTGWISENTHTIIPCSVTTVSATSKLPSHNSDK